MSRDCCHLIWTIGGHDPSGAAGLQVDQRVAAAAQVHAAAVVTAVTAQNFSECSATGILPAEMVLAQLAALQRTRPPLAIKIGMLGSEPLVAAVGAAVAALGVPTILDPVLAASAGAALLDAAGRAALIRDLLPLVTVVTPNLLEAEAMTGLRAQSAEDLPILAAALRALGARAVLIKGGHLPPSERSPRGWIWDYFTDGTTSGFLATGRRTGSVRGTGCALATAIAAFMAHGESLPDAVILGKALLSAGFRHRKVPVSAGPAVLHFGPGIPDSLRAEDIPLVDLSTFGREGRAQAAAVPLEASAIGFYPIVDRASWVGRLADAGARVQQIRIKDLDGEARLTELEAAVQAARSHNVKLFINDDWRAAIRLGAYGVHLGQEDLTDGGQEAIVAIASSGLRLGVSTHSPWELARALAISPSYVALGPIFPTTCKSMAFGPQGLQRLAMWRRLTDLPLVAIGGLTPERAAAALAAGANGVAVIADVLNASSPEARAREWAAVCT